jgi:hypothetical protein
MNLDSVPEFSNVLLRGFTSYPHFSIVNDHVQNLPLDLKYEECLKLAQFLNENNQIYKIEYFELIKLLRPITSELSSLTHCITKDAHFNQSDKPSKILRTSRHFPYFTILRIVSELPVSLTHYELQELAEYLDNHHNILSIGYDDLCELLHLVRIIPQTAQTPQTVQTAQTAQTAQVLAVGENPVRTLTTKPESLCEKTNYQCLKKVVDLPDDLEDEEYQCLASYMSTHPEIQKIQYFELLNRAEPRSPKRRRVFKSKK